MKKSFVGIPYLLPVSLLGYRSPPEYIVTIHLMMIRIQVPLLMAVIEYVTNSDLY